MVTPSEKTVLRAKVRAAWRAWLEVAVALDEKIGLTWLLLGTRIPHREKSGESGVEASILLLAIVTGNTITVGVAVHERGQTVGWMPLGLYFFASLIPLGAMTFLLRASVSKKRGSEAVHRFNPATIWITRWNLLAGFLLVFVSIGLVRANLFPGQPIPKPVFFASGNARDYKSTDFPKKRALTFDIHINRKEYPKGIPEHLPFTIEITDPKLRESWEIVRVDGFKLVEGKEVPVTPGPFFISTETPHRKGAFWQDLERDADYLLRVYIFSVKDDEPSQEDYEKARKLITDGQGITVLDEPPL